MGLHQEDVRKFIDMTPEAVDHDLTIVAQGTPKWVASDKKSHTAPFIATLEKSKPSFYKGC
ncbi:hypothetical protein ACFPK9_08345 [Rubritalea spongiae]|uniref:Uncharacterized protein n=1 Tax=Rubritalea spongiae TaxID=430797 RepID=A0ABW5E1M6_9BACT